MLAINNLNRYKLFLWDWKMMILSRRNWILFWRKIVITFSFWIMSNSNKATGWNYCWLRRWQNTPRCTVLRRRRRWRNISSGFCNGLWNPICSSRRLSTLKTFLSSRSTTSSKLENSKPHPWRNRSNYSAVKIFRKDSSIFSTNSKPWSLPTSIKSSSSCLWTKA